MRIKLPINEGKNKFSSGYILAGDIGATKTNLGLYRWDGYHLSIEKEVTYKTRDIKEMVDTIKDFTLGIALPERLCLGVAGPVIDGKVNITNLSRQLDEKELTRQLSKKVVLINDLEATAYGLSTLEKNDIYIFHKGNKEIKGNIAIIAPGTGLGEAGLFWDGKYYYPFATEGGHTDFAPRTEMDIELYRHLHKIYGHVSWERLVSGPGINAIYDFLVERMDEEEPSWLKDKMILHDKAKTISDYYATVLVCKNTIDHFFRFLAEESANLILKLKATGGLYIGGGILPKILSLINKEAFLKTLRCNGRVSELLNDIPVNFILNEKTALRGAGWYGAHMKIN